MNHDFSGADFPPGLLGHLLGKKVHLCASSPGGHKPQGPNGCDRTYHRPGLTTVELVGQTGLQEATPSMCTVAGIACGEPDGGSALRTGVQVATSKQQTSSQLPPRLFAGFSSLLQIVFWALSLNLGTTCPSQESERLVHKDTRQPSTASPRPPSPVICQPARWP